ncbi:ROK family protein [Sulfuriroseicoccus oceanibius]|uniref:ROK family protein n=1 Tax=Sulfuriroseicoccus oceanibius TaxID=2707525 RepID=A0A6B3LCL7_9BACT|nr:ROK family protein [Sulfuriroseicoccus oceanibius]QQL45416.1 ROK family protein [Sulfuriroseicoccus oceanibius]
MLAIGVDFGGTSVKVGLCDGAEVLEKMPRIPTKDFGCRDDLVAAIVGQIKDLQARHEGVVGVGAGVPGNVDYKRGRIHQLTNVEGWVDVPLRELLEKKTGLVAAVDNDANCMAYAEWRVGAGRGANDMVAITMGTGIGGGLVLDGKFFRGAACVAGEVGQMSLDYRGRVGVYGNKGCTEKYIGNQQLKEFAYSRYQTKARRDGKPGPSEADCEPRRVAEAANAGDPVAIEIWEEVAEMLATTLCNVCWLVNPSRIVIGGGVAGAGELLFSPLRAHMKEQLSDTHYRSMRIVPAKFGNDAGMIGAAMQAADRWEEKQAKA